MEMLKEYYEELHPGTNGPAKSVVYDDKGFASYWIKGKEIYIEDIYVRKEFRRSHAASHYADQIAEIGRQNDCTLMTGTVVPSAHNSDISLKMMLGYGFSVLESEDNLIWFGKKLDKENPNV